MTVEIISLSISMKVWDRARIELAAPVFAVRLSSLPGRVAQSVTCLAIDVHELLVNRLFKPAQEKVWLGELTGC